MQLKAGPGSRLAAKRHLVVKKQAGCVAGILVWADQYSCVTALPNGVVVWGTAKKPITPATGDYRE